MDNIVSSCPNVNKKSADLSVGGKRAAKVAVNLYVPVNFDASEVVPPKLTGDANWFVHTVFTRRVFDKRSREGFVNLKAAYLRQHMSFRKYAGVIDALERAGVIEVDRHYVRGMKSRGYRLTEIYKNQPHRRVRETKLSVVRAGIKYNSARVAGINSPVHKELFHWLGQVTVCPHAVVSDPVSSHQLACLSDQFLHFSVCDYGRVHSNLSSLKRTSRQYLRVDNKKLVNVDLACSQPLLLSVLCLSKLGYSVKEDIKLDTVTDIEPEREKVKEDIKTDIEREGEQEKEDTKTDSNYSGFEKERRTQPASCTPTTLRCDFFGLPDDVRRFVKLTTTGKLYDWLVKASDGKMTRDEIKRKLFKNWLFCKSHEKYSLGRLMAKKFPTVTGVILDMKRDDYRAAAHQLQRLESDTVVNGVTAKFFERNPGAFAGLIHDSVLVHPEHAETIRALFLSEFAERFGVRPTVRIDVL